MPDLFGDSLDDELEEVGRAPLPVPDLQAPILDRDEGPWATAVIPSEGCLGCNLIEISAVTLSDGETVVCSSCPEYRHECEVRHVATMATKAMRRTYLYGVEERRGASAAKRITDSLWAMHKHGVRVSQMVVEVKKK